MTRTVTGRKWTGGALAFAVGYGLLRLYWAAGGRWGYTACDRTSPPSPAEISTGCGAEQLATLPTWSGWGAVGLCGVLVAVMALATLRPGRAASAGAWVATAALVALSFPGHLLFQIPAALAGQPTDWRDLTNRLLLLGCGLLFGAAAAAVGPGRCRHPRTDGPRSMPRWVRGWAYAGCAAPVLGFTVPHALWLLGVPFGIAEDDFRKLQQELNLSLVILLALVIAPSLGGLLTLGLAHRWGQVFPRWTPGLTGRRVPRLLALIPAGVVALALISYGLIGLGMITEALFAGRTTWSELRSGWAVAGTEVAFLAWGVALGVATLGYHLVTRPRCEVCEPTRPERSVPGRSFSAT
jgi:hypothetical protein